MTPFSLQPQSSIVQNLITGVLVLVSLLMATPAEAGQCPSNTRPKSMYALSIARIAQADIDKDIEKYCEIGQNVCKDQLIEVQNAERNAVKACSNLATTEKVDGSITGCVRIITKCMGERNSQATNGFDWSTLANMPFLSGMGPAAQSAMGQMNNAFSQPPTRLCSRFSRTDFFTRRKDIESEIKDKDKEIKDLDEEIQTLQKEVEEAKKDAEEEIARLDKELAEARKDDSDNEREKSLEIVQRRSQIQEAILSADREVLKRRIEINEAERSFNLELIRYSESTAQLQCMTEVLKIREEMMKNGVFNPGSASFAANKAKQAQLNQQFEICTKTLAMRRLNLFSKHEETMGSLRRAIAEAESAKASAESELKSQEEAFQKAMQDLKTFANQREQRVLQQKMAAQQNLMNAMSRIAARQQQMKQNQATMQTKLAELRRELSDLGPEPEGDNDVSANWRTAMNNLIDYSNAVGNFRQSVEKCCGDGPHTNHSERYCKTATSGANSVEKDVRIIDEKLKGKSRSGTR